MPRKTNNILFIMYDQLRFDYLSCAGHKTLHTPHFDRVAEMGVRFSRCYVQSPVCGASRMSFYTGRYCHSHGAQWNGYPLRVGEHTLGDHLRAIGMDCHLIGKTHMRADAAGMQRLGMSETSEIGIRQSECGFDPYIREDGLMATGPDGFYDARRSPYNEYLKDKGYTSDNPWHDFANASIDDNGDIASGFLMQNAMMPANIREEDSETPWLTTRTIDFIEQQSDDKPWLAHVSYIKPHWPYIVPAPYNDMYSADDIKPLNRSDSELESPNPVYEAFTNNGIGKAFHKAEVREKVIPAYMGLIKQCDDQLGRLLDYLENTDRLKDTMIVLTSDHGDYLGDHWLGEKDLFHDASSRVPLIIYDPSAAADATRGTVCDELVESIDCVPTFIEAAGGEVPNHIVEGHSLMPFLIGTQPDNWREYAISEYDFAVTPMRSKLGLSQRESRLFMVADKRWKFMHSESGCRPMLFDLTNDPDELNDLGKTDEHNDIIDLMYQRLGQWARRMSQRVTLSDTDIENMMGRSRRRGILLGLYDGSEADDELLVKYKGAAPANHLQQADKKIAD
jgi:arylsulfatase A-like enzyme